MREKQLGVYYKHVKTGFIISRDELINRLKGNQIRIDFYYNNPCKSYAEDDEAVQVHRFIYELADIPLIDDFETIIIKDTDITPRDVDILISSTIPSNFYIGEDLNIVMNKLKTQADYYYKLVCSRVDEGTQ